MNPTKMTKMNNQNMTGQELKNLRLKHLKAKKEELTAKLASTSLPEEKRAAMTARQGKISERIAVITTKLKQKPAAKNELVQQGLAPSAAAEEASEKEQGLKQIQGSAALKAQLKAQRAARARDALAKPGPLQRAACVESKLAHVRTVLANLALPPQRKARLEAKEQRLTSRLAVLLGPTGPTTEDTAEEEFVEVADACDAKADAKGSTEEVRTATDKVIVRVQARLVHVKSVLGNPALPAERRLRLEAKEKVLTARLQEISAGGGKGKGKGAGKHAGKGQGGFSLGRGGKGHGKGNGKSHGKGHGKGKGLGMGKRAEETCDSGDE